MSLAKKLQKWVENDLISAEQSKKISEFEKQRGGSLFIRTSFLIVGLLIGWGVCLLIASNWDSIPSALKIIGVFALAAVSVGFALKEQFNPQSKRKEMFLVLSFLLLAAIIGLVGQIFNLDGGWQSFALAWSLLGLPYVWFSRSIGFNVAWVWLFLNGIFTGKFVEWLLSVFPWLRYFDFEHHIILLTFCVVVFFSLLALVAQKIDSLVHKHTRLAEAFGMLCGFSAYCVAFSCGFHFMYGYKADIISTATAHTLVFAFLAYKMFCAVRLQNMNAFKLNAFLAEIYIFLIFASCFGNLFATGIGFILGGLLIWALIHILKKTSRYIKGMEIFND